MEGYYDVADWPKKNKVYLCLWVNSKAWDDTEFSFYKMFVALTFTFEPLSDEAP